MLDIETMSTRFNASIVSIGAVKFDIDTFEVVDRFIVNVSLKNCVDLGLHIDQETVKWWNKQNPEAVKAFLKDPIPLKDALERFSEWYGSDPDMVWCNGANFDFPIMTNAYELFELKPPWKYWHICDCRTVINMAGLTKQYLDEQREIFGTLYHSAIDDCEFQVNMLKKLLLEVPNG